MDEIYFAVGPDKDAYIDGMDGTLFAERGTTRQIQKAGGEKMKEIHEKWQDPTEETADMKRLRYEIVLTCRMYQETYGLGDDCLVACLKNATDQIGCSATENELRNDVSMRLSLIENGLKEAVKQIGSMRTDLQSKNGFYENYNSQS